MTEETDLTVVETTTEKPLSGDGEVEVGQWYWVLDEDHKGKKYNWFGCVTRIGTNYAKIESPWFGNSRHVARIHFDKFAEECKLEPDPDGVIKRNIAHYQDKVGRLMGRVQEITNSIAVSPNPQLTASPDTQALATLNDAQDFDSYKSALVQAKEHDLPDLFKQIREANKDLAGWMSAQVVPLEAKAEEMRGVIDTVEGRIFSVELYAGLTEKVKQISDGEPADVGDKLHVLQRRCYMDEECLARYEAGGMDYRHIGEFDNWLARPGNRDRILPFPRCIVSFRIRRTAKEREAANLSDWIRIQDEEEADRGTYLFIRNGEQLFRMSTSLEFGEKLFPDLDHSILTSGDKLYASGHGSRIEDVISEREYNELVREKEEAEVEYQRELAEWEIKKKEAEANGEKAPSKPWHHHYSRVSEYSPYDDTNVYFDDITKKIAEDIRHHNRIALIIQGLFDRSPVLAPHPKVKTWTAEGFDQAVTLIYDKDRALNPKDLPDFEAYRARLNASLQTGSVTVGQEDAWEQHEAEKENRRRDNDWRDKGDWRPSRYRPYGNPGPGLLARVARCKPLSKKCTFEWERERLVDHPIYRYKPIKTRFHCDADQLLNVDAYTPGDFRQFFDDPRTREQYLQWAPLLLVAEDYHAGKAKITNDPEGFTG